MAPRGAGGFEDGEHEVDFEVELKADLEWIEAHVGPMLAVVGRLGASWRVLGAILRLS